MRMETMPKGEDVDQKTNAEKVDLIGLSLDFLPNPFINVAAITKLDLSNNDLELIPESLTARMVNVVVLDVHSNQLRVLPNSIGCLTKLKVLNVSGNLIESLPETIEDCRALEELNANFNKLTRLPDTMGFELANLQKLSVNSNKLTHLPYSTSHMMSLRILDTRLNCLRSLPEGLENLSPSKSSTSARTSSTSSHSHMPSALSSHWLSLTSATTRSHISHTRWAA